MRARESPKQRREVRSGGISLLPRLALRSLIPMDIGASSADVYETALEGGPAERLRSLPYRASAASRTPARPTSDPRAPTTETQEATLNPEVPTAVALRIGMISRDLPQTANSHRAASTVANKAIMRQSKAPRSGLGHPDIFTCPSSFQSKRRAPASEILKRGLKAKPAPETALKLRLSAGHCLPFYTMRIRPTRGSRTPHRSKLNSRAPSDSRPRRCSPTTSPHKVYRRRQALLCVSWSLAHPRTRIEKDPLSRKHNLRTSPRGLAQNTA